MTTTDPSVSTPRDPRVLQQLRAVIAANYELSPDPSRWREITERMAVAVVDTLVVDIAALRWHEDGSITVAWPAGVDPDRDPADGLQTILVDVRLFARMTERLNAQAAELARLRRIEVHHEAIRTALGEVVERIVTARTNDAGDQPAPTPPLSPDCKAGKHTACVGDAWDDAAERLTDCACECHR